MNESPRLANEETRAETLTSKQIERTANDLKNKDVATAAMSTTEAIPFKAASPCSARTVSHFRCNVVRSYVSLGDGCVGLDAASALLLAIDLC